MNDTLLTVTACGAMNINGEEREGVFLEGSRDAIKDAAQLFSRDVVIRRANADHARSTSDAPERIWAAPEHPDEDGYGGFWAKYKVAPAIEYVRADLVPRWFRFSNADNPPPKDGCLAFYRSDECIYDVIWSQDGNQWISRDGDTTNFRQRDFTWWKSRDAPEDEE